MRLGLAYSPSTNVIELSELIGIREMTSPLARNRSMQDFPSGRYLRETGSLCTPVATEATRSLASDSFVERVLCARSSPHRLRYRRSRRTAQRLVICCDHAALC